MGQMDEEADRRGEGIRGPFHSFPPVAPLSRAYKIISSWRSVFQRLHLFLFLSDITFVSLGQSAGTLEALRGNRHRHARHFYANVKGQAAALCSSTIFPAARKVE